MAVGAPAALPELAVVTAYNPASRLHSPRWNRAAHRALRARLDALGTPWLPARAHGSGPGARRWDEPGFALTGPGARRTALALAEELGQNAIVAARPEEPARLWVARRGFCGGAPGDPL